MNRHPCAAHRFTPCRASFAARLLCTSLAVGAAAATLHGAAHAQPAAEAAAQRSYAIPPGPLGPALNRLGRESGALITFTPELVAGAQTRGARQGGCGGAHGKAGAQKARGEGGAARGEAMCCARMAVHAVCPSDGSLRIRMCLRA